MTTTIDIPSIGDTLRNGATLLAIRPDPRWGPHTFFVLCRYQGTYVTWVLNAEEGQGGCSYGDYHNDDLAAATDSFDNR
jgi:hypothetical protein